jgi:hypothetical protein
VKLKQSEKAAAGTIRGLFCQALHIKDTSKWIPQGKNRQVLLGACVQAYNELGKRLQHVAFYQDDQRMWHIDPKTSGVFKFLPEAGPKKKIKHISGAIANIPESLTLTDDFSITKSWFEHMAQVEEGRLTQNIQKLFDPAQVATMEAGRAEPLNMAILTRFGLHLGEIESATAVADGGPGAQPPAPAGRQQRPRLL